MNLERPPIASPSPPLRWTLIIPCAAPLQSDTPSRPNYLLTTPDGELLVRHAAQSMPADRVGRIVVTVLRDAEDRYKARKAIRRAFGDTVTCIVLDQATEGPAETVRETIEQAGISGPIAIKDGDTFFSLDEVPDCSFMAVSDVRALGALSEPGRKSYVRLSEQGMISDVIEKSVQSNYISVGLYGFADSSVFANTFDKMSEQMDHKRLFVSHIVAGAILESHVFRPSMARGLVDLGTMADWNAFRAEYATIVLDIDGVVFRNQSEFFTPFWGEPVEPIRENVEHILVLQQQGAQLVFMTARPEAYRSATEEALLAQGFKIHALVMGCNHSTRFLVNDYAQSNLYPSAVAINVERNHAQLRHLLLPGLIIRNRDI